MSAVPVLVVVLLLGLEPCTAQGTITRLPRTAWPLQYRLFIHTDPLGTFFRGNVTMQLEVVEETDSITLHSRGLTLSPASLHHQDHVGNSFNISSQEEQRGGTLVLKLNDTLPRGRYSLHIPFKGQLNTAKQRGYYRVRTGQQDSDWMSGTVFEYDYAREAFPCFDEPEFKARFRLSMAHHSNMTALSNMPVTASEPYGEGKDWVVDHFENSPEMSSYLVAFHLLQWDSRGVAADDGKAVRVWAPTKHLRWANNSLTVTPKALTALTDYTGLSDPVPKLDLVMVPRFRGALENWGVISLMPSAVLYKPRWDGELGRVLNSKVLVHELVHSWFGNLVTPKWWDSLWLSEGAATFFASLILDKLEPSWEQLAEDTEEYLTTTFLNNALSSGQALSSPVELTQDLRKVSFAPYYKGFAVFRMLYYSVGPQQFQAGIRHYLSTLQYKTATPQQFYEAFGYNYESHNLSTLMHAWTYELGLPVVSVNRSNGKLLLTQERFNLNQLESEEEFKDDGGRWWVPVTYVTHSPNRSQEGVRPVAWFLENTSLPDPAEATKWLLLNDNAAGTYHVRYDKSNLDLIKATLNSSIEDIPALNRFQLVLDYGMFALAGLEPLIEVLDLMEYLERERHFAPWSAALRTFWRLDQRLRGTPSQHKLRVIVRRLLAPEFSRLGLRSRKNDTVPMLRQRQQIAQFACLYQMPECLKRANRLYLKWESQTVPDKINPVPPEVRLTVYCSAVRDKGERAWQFLRERAVHTRDPVTRDNLFTALGCTTNYSLLYNFVEGKENSSLQNFTRHDFAKVLQGLVQYNQDIGPVLDFMERSMLKLKSLSKKKLRWNQTMLRDLSQQITSEDQLEQLSKLTSMNKLWRDEDSSSMRRMVRHNAAWREKNQNIL